MSQRINGFVRTVFMDRGFCFLREKLTGIDTFVHQGDFEFDADSLATLKNTDVTYEVIEYEKDGKKMRKAIHVTLTPDAIGGAQ
jgi:hypothetical protein